MSENPIHTNQLIPLQNDNNALTRVNTQLSTTNKILVKVGEQGLREWWEGLSEEWKRIFLINLEFHDEIFYHRLSKQVRFKIWCESLNPKEIYQIAFGKDLAIADNISIDTISKIISVKWLFCAKTQIRYLNVVNKIKDLQGIDIRETNIQDFTPLTEISNLRWLCVDKEIADEIKSIVPNCHINFLK
ncbi:MAG: hypothetical protein MUE81_11680 [Thermoflexibacter sp.]|jgi:hypothetical protein|nr:hypothetical protein [Thermoflexibacter sp.]